MKDNRRKLIIPVTDLSRSEIDDLSSLVVADGMVEVVPRQARASRAELIRLQEAVNSDLVGISSELGSWSIGVNTVSERVEVHISPAAERGQERRGPSQGRPDGRVDLSFVKEMVESRARSHMANSNAARGLARRDVALESLVTVEEGAGVVIPETDFRESAHIRGGEWVRSDNRGVCSTNFLWKKGSQYRIGTAGHCSTTGGSFGDPRSNARTFDHARFNRTRNGRVGDVNHNGWTNNTRSDYALMTLPAAATGTSRVMTTSGNWRTVTSVVAESSVGGPWTWCHVGFGIFKNLGLNKSCGTITQANVSATVNMNDGSQLTIQGLYCKTGSSRGGDSGGAVYYETGDDAWAVGIHFGKRNGEACFTTVGASTARHGYNVVTS